MTRASQASHSDFGQSQATHPHRPTKSGSTNQKWVKKVGHGRVTRIVVPNKNFGITNVDQKIVWGKESCSASKENLFCIPNFFCETKEFLY